MSAADVISDPIGSLTGGGQKHANKKNAGNLAQIKALFKELNLFGDQQYGKALGEIDKVGGASKAAALSQEKQYLSGAQQQLGSSGMWGSTVGPNMQRGIHSDTLRVLGGIDEQLAQLRAGLFTGQAGFRQGNMLNLAGILSGVQYKGSNVTADLAKTLSSIFGTTGSGGIKFPGS